MRKSFGIGIRSLLALVLSSAGGEAAAGLPVPVVRAPARGRRTSAKSYTFFKSKALTQWEKFNSIQKAELYANTPMHPATRQQIRAAKKAWRNWPSRPAN